MSTLKSGRSVGVEPRYRAVMRVSLELLTGMLGNGAHAYAVSGGIPKGARVAAVKTDHEREIAMIFVESEKPLPGLALTHECGFCVEMNATLWQLDEGPWLPPDSGVENT